MHDSRPDLHPSQPPYMYLPCFIISLHYAFCFLTQQIVSFMTDPFSYSSTFVLDKAHFQECFSNSVVARHSLVAYSKAVILLLFGGLLLEFTQISGYFCYFLMVLGVVEALSIYYQQPWWVTRQMLSRNANREVILTLDETGVHSQSAHLNTQILWQEISEVKHTKNGLILVHTTGRSYISAACLSAQASTFLLSKLDTK